jgi:hypothetical protein
MDSPEAIRVNYCQQKKFVAADTNEQQRTPDKQQSTTWITQQPTTAAPDNQQLSLDNR